MQKIIVKNFLGIKEVDVKIGKILVIIGEQASGKSTLAKLIYFFQTIKEDIFDAFYYDKNNINFNAESLDKFILNKFYNLFGSTKSWPPFEVSYTYGSNRTITLSISGNDEILEVKVTPYFQESILKTCQDIVNNSPSDFLKILTLPINQALSHIDQVETALDQLFELKQIRFFVYYSREKYYGKLF